ncbi:Translocation and assembly module TamA precursor [Aquimixticola soesokkakensis]|uniref:Translocation and assembly module TamA n=1 Tax=Aquimixticola soesokkakensis TaxID=1519096 RepID=A0A1Y5S5U9_9RHOB|nr:autotransporter assembly complex family protein [Aquimixticola soesokkakensis]SLN33169.1 Translocation and assembly module TamA precursor [Aquimixticola soesokkakensis]
MHNSNKPPVADSFPPSTNAPRGAQALRRGVSCVALALVAAAGLATSQPAQALDIRWSDAQNGDLDKDLLKTLKGVSLTETAQAEDETDSQSIISAAQSDYRQVVGVLYRDGYYGPNVHIYIDGVEASQRQLINPPATVENVLFVIDTGPQFSFGQAEVGPLATLNKREVAEANTVPEAFATGEVAKSALVGKAKDAAIEGWRQDGYPMAALSRSDVVANHPSETLNVALGITPGPKATMGALTFSGETRVRPERMVAIAGYPTGKEYDPDLMTLVTTRLQRTGTFTSVSLSEADRVNPDGTYDATVATVDYKPRRFGFGAELSSVDGLTISSYWYHRNITGAADRLRFDAEVAGIGSPSGEDYTLSTTYRRPATFWTDTTLVATATASRLDEPDYLSKLVEGQIGLEAIVSPTFNATASIGYRYSEDTDDLGTREFHHIIFPIEIEGDYRRPNSLNPVSGNYYTADITPYIGVQGSTSGARFYGDARRYFSLGAQDRIVLAGRVMAGSIVGSDLDTTPADLLFYSGGGGTVRGQPYQSLGVTTEDGADVGGLGYLGLNAEVRGKITDKIQLVGFYDYGTVGTSSVPGQDAKSQAGAGLGLRYNTGVGPIRLDVATPVSGETGDGIQVYIGIGQAF